MPAANFVSYIFRISLPYNAVFFSFSNLYCQVESPGGKLIFDMLGYSRYSNFWINKGSYIAMWKESGVMHACRFLEDS